jgi:hypothetical protein
MEADIIEAMYATRNRPSDSHPLTLLKLQTDRYFCSAGALFMNIRTGM